MNRKSALLLPLVLTACAAAPGGTSPGGSASPAGSGAPIIDRQKVVQPGYFDVGILTATPPAIPKQVNNDVLFGVEMAARPLIIECLVDPQNRGPDKLTKVVVDATLADAGVNHKVTGQNLTPAGIACISAALGKWTALAAGLNAKNAASGGVTAHTQIDHIVGVSPSVVLGMNEFSDIAGAIRLALPAWSDCLADWKSAPPRTLTASVKIVRTKSAADAGAPPAAGAPGDVTPAEVTFQPAGDPTADKVAACLKNKVMALKVKAPKGESVTLPYLFRFVHSGIADASLPGATTDMDFAQMDVQRNRRQAESAVMSGDANVARATYNTAVDAYKNGAKDPKAPQVSVLELKDKCKALLDADDRLIEAVQRSVALEETTHRFTADQKAKDPTWADAEAASARQLAETQKLADTLRNSRKVDEGVCPKVH